MLTKQISAPLEGHFEEFRQLIGQMSLESVIPLLGARHRWKLVIEMLLGHAPVRGGRSRDFPFSEQRLSGAKISTTLAKYKISFRPGRSEKKATFSAYDLVVSILLVETSKQSFLSDDVESECHFSAAMMYLTTELFGSTHSTSIQNLLGISAEGIELKRYIKSYKPTWLLAQTVSSLAHTDVPNDQRHNPQAFLEKYFDLRPHTKAELHNSKVSLIYLKTKRIQSFLDRCSLSFIQRGASFWCSQVSSRVRDVITEFNDGRSTILIDNDAITIATCPTGINIEELKKTVTDFFVDDKDPDQLSETFLRRFYPRLIPYYQVARNECHATINVMPAIGLSLREDKSLFELAVERTYEFNEEESTEPQTIIEFTYSQNAHYSLGCSGRKGDVRLGDEKNSVPIWYNPNGIQGYGWASIVFSLVGMSYNRLINESMQDILHKRCGSIVQTVRTQKELLKNTGGGDHVSYLKFDGDRIGHKFSQIPLIQRPALSLKLEVMMREAWTSALAELIKSNQLNCVPADLLYFGGDDLLAVLPEGMCLQFVKYFDDALSIHNIDDQSIRFTFAVISDKPLASTVGKGDENEPLHPQIIHLVNELLNKAKAIGRDEVESTEMLCFSRVAGLSSVISKPDV